MPWSVPPPWTTSPRRWPPTRTPGWSLRGSSRPTARCRTPYGPSRPCRPSWPAAPPTAAPAGVGPPPVEDLASARAAHPHAGMGAARLLSPDGSVQDSVRSFKTVQTLRARRTPYGSTRRGRAVLAAHLGGTAEIDPTAGAVPVDWALGAALYVRRKAIDAVGPLDPRFFLYEEDADWCARMWAGGWQVLYAPWIVASHGYRRESRRTWDLRHAPTRHHWDSILDRKSTRLN